MDLQIEVAYPDGSTSLAGQAYLDVLIATGRIAAFRRADGWAWLGDPGVKLRDYTRTRYRGPERRDPWS
jgi:hypothetical protein